MKQLHITPDGTYIDGKHHSIDYIMITLPDGRTIDIETAANLISKKLPKRSRLKSAIQAFREADTGIPSPEPTLGDIKVAQS